MAVLKRKKHQPRKLYLDVCTLCRPFDDQHLLRIRLETDACYLILRAFQGGKCEMIVSPVHLEEVNSIGDPQERSELLALLAKFSSSGLNDLPRTRMRAEELYSMGFGIADAAHVAFAESCADFFISCDDKLVKRCRKRHVNIRTMNPVEFCFTEGLK